MRGPAKEKDTSVTATGTSSSASHVVRSRSLVHVACGRRITSTTVTATRTNESRSTHPAFPVSVAPYEPAS